MAQLEIYITEAGGNTVSQYYVTKTQHVTFYNEAEKIATIVVKDPVGTDVLCEKNNGTNPQSTFPVPAKNAAGKLGEVKMFICPGYAGKTFKYSAQIEGTNKEDPIIIIGKDSKGPSIVANVPILVTGFIAGVVLTLIAQRLFMRRRPT